MKTNFGTTFNCFFPGEIPSINNFRGIVRNIQYFRHSIPLTIYEILKIKSPNLMKLLYLLEIIKISTLFRK